MCCRKKANPLNLMNRDWKSERGREERREARRRARAMNSSPCSKETKCWKEKGDKQRWRERKGKKKRWSYPRRCKHNKKSKEKYQKKGGEKERERMRGQLGLIWGNQPLRSRLPHTASYEIGNLGPFVHTQIQRTHGKTRTHQKLCSWSLLESPWGL